MHLGDATHQRPNRLGTVLRLLHREADEVVNRRIDLLRGLGVELPRQINGTDGAVCRLALQPDAHFCSLGIDQLRRGRAAYQGHVVSGHQQLGAKQRAVGSTENEDVIGHLFRPEV